MNARDQKASDIFIRRDEGYLLLGVIREVVADTVPTATQDQLDLVNYLLREKIDEACRNRYERLPAESEDVAVGELVSFD